VAIKNLIKITTMKSPNSMLIPLLLVGFFMTSAQLAYTQIDLSIIKGFKLRNLTPHSSGGRIVDVAVDKNNKSLWYVVAASGNVWRTRNAGTTWQPIFEKYGSYSIGVIEIDPNDSNVLWLGTGENNAQRSVSKGDGVYKSINGGKTWTNMGLKTSEHIGKIVIDPRNSNVVYVAAQGGLWAAGGERGLYKTVDGGVTWKRILNISENTGISDIIFDPRNPDILLVSSYQRRRHPGLLVAGGPDGGIWKSTDAGANWVKLKNGLPDGDLGRIGLAISPQNPDVTYALVAGTDDTKGFYRSSNLGENWTKMSDYMVIDAQYYMELYPDPHQFDKVYSVNTFIQVTEDGGKTFSNMNNTNMHVDHHEIVFDPDDPNHLLIGNDGGLYETWDGTKTWRFFDNMPLTQFYRVGIDQDYPFYNVYGGTQDNSTLGGPSQTTNSRGISNNDWFITTGGDGFQTRVDPDNPDIVYSESQYGYLVRFDKKSQERIGIQPQPQPQAGEPPFRWHWNAPILISPHKSNRLYFAAERVFKSEDRGNSWTTISVDLSLNRDRNKLPVMDRVWGVDAIFKNVWTSPMGTIVAMDESPITEGLLYAGTDDGQISVSKNGGDTWQKLSQISGVPEYTYVADLHASRTQSNTVFALFNNHKFGDFQPYIYVSQDAGTTWSSIKGDLPEGEYLWSIYQDHINPNLLFLGAEYGLYVSVDGGKHWNKFTSGIPTIAIRDLEIQQREDDLVAASFGRGFYILDDYSPLRKLNQETLRQEAFLLPIQDALQYVPYSLTGRAWGDSHITSLNPDYGATITYYIKTGATTRKQQRRKTEREKVKAGEPVYYPEWEVLAEERMETKPQVVITILDESGQAVDRITTPLSSGVHRINWNLRDHQGIKVRSGKYTATMATVVNGDWQTIDATEAFEVRQLDNATLPSKDFANRQVFYSQVVALRNKVNRAQTTLSKVSKEIKQATTLALKNPNLEGAIFSDIKNIEKQLYQFTVQLNGNRLMAEKMELIPPSINSRLWNTNWGNSSTSDPTITHRMDYDIASKEYSELVDAYHLFVAQQLIPLAKKLQAAEASFDLTVEKLEQ